MHAPGETTSLSLYNISLQANSALAQSELIHCNLMEYII